MNRPNKWWRNVGFRGAKVLMLSVCVVGLVVSVDGAPASAAPKRSHSKSERKAAEAAPAATNTSTTTPTPAAAEASSEGASATVDGKKAKVLSFGAVDVEGKMRTPQLLFFVNRVKAELDSTTQLQRSFMKDLKNTAKEKGL